jgi:hypothetical protein
MTTTIIDPRSRQLPHDRTPFLHHQEEVVSQSTESGLLLLLRLFAWGAQSTVSKAHVSAGPSAMSAPDLWFNRNRKRCISSQRQVGEKNKNQRIMMMMDIRHLCSKLALLRIAIFPHLDYSTTCVCRRPKIHGSSINPRDR